LTTTVDDLIDFSEPEDLAACSLPQLRELRDGYQEIENGFSYARRIVQGRLDTVSVELERRAEHDADTDLVHRLPTALAAHTRGPGLPRPGQGLEPPAWADDVVAELDRLLTPAQVGHLTDLEDAVLLRAAEDIAGLERDLSASRQDLHRRIDRVQSEIVGRYRGGASVDDLLR
jgi:hypothetical protein